MHCALTLRGRNSSFTPGTPVGPRPQQTHANNHTFSARCLLSSMLLNTFVLTCTPQKLEGMFCTFLDTTDNMKYNENTIKSPISTSINVSNPGENSITEHENLLQLLPFILFMLFMMIWILQSFLQGNS